MDRFNQERKEEAARNGEHKGGDLGDSAAQVIEILDAIELEMVNLEVDPDNAECMNAIGINFKLVDDLTKGIKDSIAFRIITDTHTLIGMYRHLNMSASRDFINIVLQSVLFLRQIFNQAGITEEQKIQNKIEQHLSEISQLREETLMEVKQLLQPQEKRIGEILVQDGAIRHSDVEEVLEKQSSLYQKLKFGEIALKEKKMDAKELIKAIRVQKTRNDSNDTFVRIPVERLDQILDIAKGLVSIQNKLHHESVLRFGSNDAYTTQAKQAEDMSADIREILCELRRVNLKNSFRKLTRVVRTMIEERGLDVVFSTTGEQTEINKEMADDLVMPLAKIVDLMLSDFSSTNEEKTKIGSIEVAAYMKHQTIMIDVMNHVRDCSAFLKQSSEIKEIQSGIERIKGKAELKINDKEGCKVQIILQS